MADDGANEERLDRELAIERLNAALKSQYRSVLGYSLVASSLSGLDAVALAGPLREFGDQELNDLRLLVEKLVSLAGEPVSDVGALEFHREAEAALEWLVGCEEALIEDLQAAIAPTGREGRSEALEHLLEHMIMRKQHQVDFLRRAIGEPVAD
jgi:bacterioferritin (cytochrome b1)